MSNTIKEKGNYNHLEKILLNDIAVKLTKMMSVLNVNISELSKKSGIEEKVIENILFTKNDTSVLILLKLFHALNCEITFIVK